MCNRSSRFIAISTTHAQCITFLELEEMKLSLWLLVVFLSSVGCLATSGEVLPCDNRSKNFTISMYSDGDTVAIPADLSLCQNQFSWNAAYNVSHQ